jgi:hypothetical protein
MRRGTLLRKHGRRQQRAGKQGQDRTEVHHFASDSCPSALPMVAAAS